MSTCGHPCPFRLTTIYNFQLLIIIIIIKIINIYIYTCSFSSSIFIEIVLAAISQGLWGFYVHGAHL